MIPQSQSPPRVQAKHMAVRLPDRSVGIVSRDTGGITEVKQIASTKYDKYISSLKLIDGTTAKEDRCMICNSLYYYFSSHFIHCFRVILFSSDCYLHLKMRFS